MQSRATWAVLFILVAACGRIGYDPRAEQPDASRDAQLDDRGELDASSDMAQPDTGVDADSDLGLPLVPGISVAPVSGLTTSESGGTATFAVVLDAPPPSGTMVYVLLLSSDLGEGLVMPAVLNAFTSENWAAPQTVTVVGVDDEEADGAQIFDVSSTSMSSHSPYHMLHGATVRVTNIDNDSPGVTVTPTAGLVTSESEEDDTFTLVLNTQPTASVSIDLASLSPSEASVAPGSVTFSPENWASPQTARVTGVDDDAADGTRPFVIQTSAAVSDDPGYAGVDPDDVSGTNADNDSAALAITRDVGTTTTETGGSAQFFVALRTRPAAMVAVSLHSTDPSEGVTSDSELVFTTDNWNVPRVVTVDGVDDLVADGDQLFSIEVGPIASSDSEYAALPIETVVFRNLDNESARILAVPGSGLVTTEIGGTALFNLTLGSMPTGLVRLGITSSVPLEGVPSPSEIAFNEATWNVPQSVVVSGVDDLVADGDRPYELAITVLESDDPVYDALSDLRISAVNVDNESANIVVTPTFGLTTSETGASAAFDVSLTSEPTASVTILLSSDTPSEGIANATMLEFSTSDWSIPRHVVVTGVDDAVVDGARVYHIETAAAVSADSNYDGIDPADVAVINTDNDTAGVQVSPTSLSVFEGGAASSFSVVLASAPVGSVSIGVSSSNPSEVDVSASSLTFDALNWSTPQGVTVSAVDDSRVDGTVSANLVLAPVASGDPTYAGLDPDDVSVQVFDNDIASVVVTPTSGLVTTEAGGTASFTMVLSSQPTSNVTVSVSSSDVSEGTVAPASVIFTAGNWNVPRTVVVTGVADAMFDGNVDYTIVTAAAASSDANYSGLDVPDVSVTNNDTASVLVSPTAGLVTSELGASATFALRLTLAPAANVTINLSSADPSEVSVSPASVTFTSLDWSMDQTVTVSGLNDHIIDGDRAFTITTSAAASADGVYNGMAVADVSGVNQTAVSREAYVKASNTGAGDQFGNTIAISDDGNTMAVTALQEASASGGVNGNQADNTLSGAGAVYVYVRSGGVWTQQAYLKQATPRIFANFGWSLAFSSDGNTLAVGCVKQSSTATGIDGNEANQGAFAAGAVYVFSRSGSTWSQQAFIKASNTDAGDWFGALALSSDGNTLAVGASREGSAVAGVGADQSDNSAMWAGATYVFVRSSGVWSQQAYIKASNTETQDGFGGVMALSADGNTLAVGANTEDGGLPGINPDGSNNAQTAAGAVYIFVRSGTVWSQQAYVKSSNPQSTDFFGSLVDLSLDGNTLAVGAYREDSNATGIGGDQSNNAKTDSGAVYVFVRSGVTWSQQAYIKASNTDASDRFGSYLSLSGDGSQLAVAAPNEASSNVGIGAGQSDNSAVGAGAVYFFVRSGTTWSQHLYVKPDAINASDYFGYGVTISADGNTMAVGAIGESSNATGVGGDATDNSVAGAGAVWVYTGG